MKTTLQDITKFLWLPIVGFLVWILYKIFVKSPNDDENPPIPGDDNFNNTTDNTGLCANDVNLLNQVIANLRSAVPFSNEISWYYIIPGYQLVEAHDNYEATQGATELGQLLYDVTEKQKFSKAFQKKQGKTLDSAIVAAYGDTIYNLIARNVPNFNEFII